MKQFIKFTLVLMLGLATLGFYSCSSGNDEPKVEAKDYVKSASEIQGTWTGSDSRQYYTYSFEGDSFNCIQRHMSDFTIVQKISGTYTLKDHKIYFNGDKEVPWNGGGEIYWTHVIKDKELHIGDSPMLTDM